MMWYGVLCRKCGSMGLAELWWWYGERLTHCHCISHLITSLPPHQTPPLTFQTTSYSTSHLIPPYIAYFIPHQHLSQYTIPLCNTVFQIATISAKFHITDVPHNATFHVLHAASVSDHIYWPNIIAHVASFHHIWLWSHPIPHRTSEHHHILHPSTHHILHNTTSTNAYCAPCRSPRCTSFHLLLQGHWGKEDAAVVKWCLMSSDVSWHIRDKFRPMPKHGAINLYVHGNQKAR